MFKIDHVSGIPVTEKVFRTQNQDIAPPPADHHHGYAYF